MHIQSSNLRLELEYCFNQEVQKLKYRRNEKVTFNICA